MGVLLVVLELFVTPFDLPCTLSLPHLQDRDAGELHCRVDAHVKVAGVRTSRVVCDALAILPAISQPMRDGWYVVERGVGAWHLGYGRDRSRPLLPQFGWQMEQPFSQSTLEMLRKEGVDFPDTPERRTWSAWESDDYSIDHVTRPNGASWCTTTQIEGNGGVTTRWELCWAKGAITGASITMFDAKVIDPRCGNRPVPHRACNVASAGGWTLQARCGDAPVVVEP